MAKSRNFFGLRRGSTKSFTYQVLNGVQVTKDRVTDVANPQTTAQMRTRIAFATVAKAAAAMSELVGISFQGVTSKVASRRKFASVNASKLISQLKANSADGVVVPKGISALVPNAYIVSDGSIRNATLGVLTVETGQDGVDRVSQPGFTFQMERGVAYSAADVLNLIYGCLPGDQITVVGITSGVVIGSDEPSLQLLRDGQLLAARVVFKGETELSELPSLTIPSSAAVNTIPQLLQEYVVDLIDNSKSYSGFKQLITVADDFTAVAGSGSNVNVTYALNDGTYATTVMAAFGRNDIFAIGYFRSNLFGTSTWRFSRCELSVISPVYTQTTFDEEQLINYGYRFDVALGTYINNSASESTRFTETGGTRETLGF